MIAGTAAYMSPEQARGKTVDKRTDIWAFGCVLYEILTARPAFPGETTSDTIAAILEHEPEWSGSAPDTPPRIRQLIQRCLEKDARRRVRDIGDARLEIEEALDRRARSTPARARLAPWGVAAAALLAAGGAAALATAALGVLLAESAGRREGHAVDRLRGRRTARRHFA